MSFLGRFKSNATHSNPSSSASGAKNTDGISQSALEKHLADLTGPARPDGSDKFFGFENYGSTCYCNSIVQCLYFSPPFRERMLNFPDLPTGDGHSDDPPLTVPKSDEPILVSTSTTPGPLAANSPARRPIVQVGATALAANQRPDEKDSPDYKKKMLMQTAALLDMQYESGGRYGMDESLFTALKDIFRGIVAHSSHTGIVSPHRFLEILRRENEIFRNAMHQDAHEFLNLLLNQIVDCVDLYNKKQRELSTADSADRPAPKGWVHDLFEGLLVSETRCLTCETISQRDEAFMDLSVDLQAHSSVTSCLRKFSEEEMLCERNKFYCDNCNGLQEAEKRMKIKRLPKILALHLKRFEYAEDYARLQKLFHRVSYPFYLRLFNTTDDAEDPDRIYELYAVVVHIGGGPFHGHYVSIIKTDDRGWLLFDDELVEPVDKSYVQNFFGGEPKPGSNDPKAMACAYVLFYQETTTDAMRAGEAAERRALAARNPLVEGPSSVSHGGGALRTNGPRRLHSHTAADSWKEVGDNFASGAPSTGVISQASGTKSSMPALPRTASASLGLGVRAKMEARKEEKAAEKERKANEREAEKLARARRREEGDARQHDIRPKSQGLTTERSPRLDVGAADVSRKSQEADGKSSDEARSPVISNDAADGKDAFGSTAAKAKRAGSISLRQRIWNGGRSKDRDTDAAQPGTAQTTLSTVPDEQARTAPEPHPKDEKNSRRNRFSLAKKRSANV